jgi:hypothetical protein
MIPREILKKIRQIEIRTTRLVSETLPSVMNTRAGVLDREIRQIRQKGETFWSCFVRVFRVVRGSLWKQQSSENRL